MKAVLHATSSAFRSYNEAARIFQTIGSDDTFSPVHRDYKKALSVIDSLFRNNNSNIPSARPKFGGKKSPQTIESFWEEVTTEETSTDLGYLSY